MQKSLALLLTLLANLPGEADMRVWDFVAFRDHLQLLCGLLLLSHQNLALRLGNIHAGLHLCNLALPGRKLRLDFLRFDHITDLVSSPSPIKGMTSCATHDVLGQNSHTR